MDKREVLMATTLGHRIAEDEAEALAAYFVETDQWRKVIAGEVDVVYGPKGSGKSALYALLRQKQKELNQRSTILAIAENVRGTPVFEDLVADPPASEEQFRALWKLYFLSLIGTAFKMGRLSGADTKTVIDTLEEAGLVFPEWSLRRMLRAALEYVRRIEAVSADVKVNKMTGAPESVGAKISIREPGTEERKLGHISVDTLFEIADKAIAEEGFKFWILLDRLDVAFAESSELEGNALRALFRVYRDIAALKNFALKIFLRDDIWKRITTTGFREASHITRSITITWNPPALLHLVIRRFLHNPAIRDFYKVQPAEVLANTKKQEELFYRIFPQQVDAGKRKSTTFDWMLSRTSDGTGQTAPRELIHLLTATRDQQLKFLEMGVGEPAGEALFDRTALKAALPEVSKFRFEHTLCAEYPTLKPLVDALEGQKTQQTPATLAKIWGVSEPEALANADKLAEVGFFEKQGAREQPVFWVPFLYRDALRLVQGPAE
jgi:hypothetical protein